VSPWVVFAVGMAACGPAEPVCAERRQESLERCQENLERCSEDEILAAQGELGEYVYGLNQDEAALRETVIRRVGLGRLVESLRRTRDATLKAGIVEILREREDPPVAQVFATRGDRRALRALATKYRRWEVSSQELSYGVAVFGEQRDYAVTPHLLASLGTASLNLAGGALETLQVLYPGASPADLASSAAARATSPAGGESGSDSKDAAAGRRALA